MMNRHKSQSQGYSWTNPRKCIILLDSQASFNELFCFYSLQLIYTFLLAEKTCCLLKKLSTHSTVPAQQQADTGKDLQATMEWSFLQLSSQIFPSGVTGDQKQSSKESKYWTLRGTIMTPNEQYCWFILTGCVHGWLFTNMFTIT